MSLEEWLNSNILVKEKTSPAEIKLLLKITHREFNDLKKSLTAGMSVDAIFRTAYNAARQCAKTALRASGYRVPGSSGSHYWTIQTLRYTLKVDAIIVDQLEQFRKLRNIVEYEQAGIVSKVEAEKIIEIANILFEKTKSWLKEHHPDLLKDGD